MTVLEECFIEMLQKFQEDGVREPVRMVLREVYQITLAECIKVRGTGEPLTAFLGKTLVEATNYIERTTIEDEEKIQVEHALWRILKRFFNQVYWT